MITKLIINEQVKLNQLTINQLNNILADNESTLIVDENSVLHLVSKVSGSIQKKNAYGDKIVGLSIPDRPTVYPQPNEGYSLIAVRDGNNFKLTWGRVTTLGNYNVINGNTTYSITTLTPTHQIYNENTPDNYVFNGKIFINTIGDNANILKKYSIDNGLTYTDLNNSSTYTFSNLGGLNNQNYDVIIKDNSNTTLHTETITLNEVDYEWGSVSFNTYDPSQVTHNTFKSDDYYLTEQPKLIVTIDESPVDFPGQYNYIIYQNGVNIYETGYISNKSIEYNIVTPGEYSVDVNRLSSGYIEIGSLTREGFFIDYPYQFMWSKDNGQTYNISNFTDQTFRLYDNGEKLRVNYYVNELGSSGAKKIYALKDGTDEIYQLNLNYTQTPISSTKNNPSVIIYDVFGTKNDLFFDSIFTSEDFYQPTVIESNNKIWISSDDIKFTVNYLSTQYAGNVTEMSVLFEDINGVLINKTIGTLLDPAPPPGGVMEYEFIIFNFKTAIFPYLNNTVRVRFTLDPDIITLDDNDKISSNLKYVRYE